MPDLHQVKLRSWRKLEPTIWPTLLSVLFALGVNCLLLFSVQSNCLLDSPVFCFKIIRSFGTNEVWRAVSTWRGSGGDLEDTWKAWRVVGGYLEGIWRVLYTNFQIWLLPGIARFAPGIARSAPGIARSAPGIARSVPGIVISRPSYARFSLSFRLWRAVV